MKDGTLDHLLRTRFGRRYGPVARETAQRMKLYQTHDMNLIEIPALLHYWNDEYEKLCYERNLCVSFLFSPVAALELAANTR